MRCTQRNERRRLAITENAVAKGLRGFAAYLGSLMGADAYRKYLEHVTAGGHTGPAMTEREFWRDRMDRQDSNPQGRCC